MKYIKINRAKIIVLSFLSFLIACGTLGSFDIRAFPVEKNRLVLAFDSFYSKSLVYKIPEKWKKFDSWKERGYDQRLYRSH